MMKFLVFLCLILSSLTVDSKEEIKMCWHEGAPFASPDLPDNGFVADLVTSVFKKAGYSPKLDFIPWTRCVKSTLSLKYDVVFAMWENVDKHQQNFSFMNNTTNEDVAFITSDDSKIVSGKLKDLKNVRIGIHEGGGYNKSLLKHPGFKKIIYLDSDEQKLKMLKLNRIDLFISNPDRINFILATSLKKLKMKIKVLRPFIRSDFGSPSISKSHPKKDEIIKKYNIAYEKLCKEGFFKKLKIKHKVSFKQEDCK